MCVEHASTIDDAATLSAYPAGQLREWKSKQLEEYDRIRQGWTLDSSMAREAREASFAGVEIAITNSTIDLRGEGGKAPSAGGGGGGAIGQNARGGRGGKGGDNRLDDGDYTLPLKGDLSVLLLLNQMIQRMIPTSDSNPGAGGGGSGAVGDDAIAGDGGNGGDRVSAAIDVSELKRAGLDRTEISVGRGGVVPPLPGQLAGGGERSSIKFFAEDVLLKTINASAGVAAQEAGVFILPDGVEALSPEDIGDGLRVITLMAANAADIRDGVLFVLGGGWDHFPVPHIPFDVVWPIVCTVRWRDIKKLAQRGLFISLFHPTENEVSRQTLIMPVETIKQKMSHWICPIGATLDSEGTWVLRVHSGGLLMAELDIQVLLRPTLV